MDRLTGFHADKANTENTENTENKGDMFSTVYMNAFSQHMAFVKIRFASVRQVGKFVCSCGDYFYSHEEDIYDDFYNHIMDSFSNGKQERSAIEMIQFNLLCLDILDKVKEGTSVVKVPRIIDDTGINIAMCETVTFKNERNIKVLFSYDSLLKMGENNTNMKAVEGLIQQRNNIILNKEMF